MFLIETSTNQLATAINNSFLWLSHWKTIRRFGICHIKLIGMLVYVKWSVPEYGLMVIDVHTKLNLAGMNFFTIEFQCCVSSLETKVIRLWVLFNYLLCNRPTVSILQCKDGFIPAGSVPIGMRTLAITL